MTNEEFLFLFEKNKNNDIKFAYTNDFIVYLKCSNKKCSNILPISKLYKKGQLHFCCFACELEILPF